MSQIITLQTVKYRNTAHHYNVIFTRQKKMLYIGMYCIICSSLRLYKYTPALQRHSRCSSLFGVSLGTSWIFPSAALHEYDRETEDGNNTYSSNLRTVYELKYKSMCVDAYICECACTCTCMCGGSRYTYLLSRKARTCAGVASGLSVR